MSQEAVAEADNAVLSASDVTNINWLLYLLFLM
jgi:hypothetical protein